MSTNETSLRFYRSSLVLNNMAITLLQNGCYDQSVKTMNDSLAILKSIFTKRGNSVATRDIISERFQRASARFTQTMMDSTTKERLVEVNAVDEEDFVSMKAAAAYGSSSSIVFPIRIREVPHDGCGSDDATRQFGIILYNYGVAQLVASIAKQDEKLLCGARKAFQMAEKTYFRLTASDNTDQDLSCIMLSTLALNCLIRVLQTQKLSTEVKQVQEVVEDLELQLAEDDQYSRLLVGANTAAAA